MPPQQITAVTLSYVEYFCQDKAFHMALSITQGQHLYKKYGLAKFYQFKNQVRY
jgi:hypothetical protein